jgi:hypothetical protein
MIIWAVVNFGNVDQSVRLPAPEKVVFSRQFDRLRLDEAKITFPLTREPSPNRP